jgi:hypothetical protein
VGDRERHREVGHRQAGLLGERDELFDYVELALVAEALRPATGPVGASFLGTTGRSPSPATGWATKP